MSDIELKKKDPWQRGTAGYFVNKLLQNAIKAARKRRENAIELRANSEKMQK